MFESGRAKRPSALTEFAARLQAVAAFSRLEPAASLAAANKRTANILRQAEYDGGGDLNADLLQDDAELALHKALQKAEENVRPLLEKRAYTEALTELANLRQSVASGHAQVARPGIDFHDPDALTGRPGFSVCLVLAAGRRGG